MIGVQRRLGKEEERGPAYDEREKGRVTSQPERNTSKEKDGESEIKGEPG